MTDLVITAFDFETTGKIGKGMSAQHPKFARAVALGAVALPVACDVELSAFKRVIRPDGFEIPRDATRVHGVSTEYAQEHGVDARLAIRQLSALFEISAIVISHNYEFDSSIYNSECERLGLDNVLSRKTGLCTMLRGAPLCQIPGFYGDYKWPSLEELFRFNYGRDHVLYARFFGNREIHDPLDDTRILAVNFAKMEAKTNALADHYVSRGI